MECGCTWKSGRLPHTSIASDEISRLANLIFAMQWPWRFWRFSWESCDHWVEPSQRRLCETPCFCPSKVFTFSFICSDLSRCLISQDCRHQNNCFDSDVVFLMIKWLDYQTALSICNASPYWFLNFVLRHCNRLCVWLRKPNCVWLIWETFNNFGEVYLWIIPTFYSRQ